MSVVTPLVNSHAIVTVVLAWLFLRDLERVSWRIVLAAVLVVARHPLRHQVISGLGNPYGARSPRLTAFLKIANHRRAPPTRLHA